MFASDVKRKYQSGIILIEILLAFTISSIIICVLTSIYLASIDSFHWQGDLLTVKHSAEKVIDVLTNDIERAGVMGCVKPRLDTAITPANRLVGAVDGVMVRFASNQHAMLVAPMLNAWQMKLGGHERFSVGDVVLISDCANAEVFVVSAVSHHLGVTTVSAKLPLRHVYAANAEINFLEKYRYFVRDDKLYREDLRGRKTSLVDNIAGLRFRYTVKTPDGYADLGAIDIVDWGQVVGVAVEVEVTVRSLTKKWYSYIRLANVSL